MRFAAIDAAGEVLDEQTYYSVGGGFIVREGAEEKILDRLEQQLAEQPYPFTTGAELLEHAATSGLSIAGVMLENELVTRDEESVRAGLAHIWDVMEECKNSALTRTGVLPGGLTCAGERRSGIASSPTRIHTATPSSGRSGSTSSRSP